MMRTIATKKVIAAGVFTLFLLLIAFPAAAGDTLLSNNIGAGNEVFFIEGESSVVINGFDLTPLGVPLPVALDAVSISVDATVPGSAIDLLVYQDANGGSPVDATLVYRQTVALELTGVNRIELSQPAIITAPVVWVGFNLPVGFRFHADTSGASVLTYWAWTTGGTFDLAALSSAGVLGPGDGSEPVNIAMDGIARITAELRIAEYEEIAVGVPLDRQVFTDVAQDTSIMQPYSSCASLFFDPEDIEISAGSSFTLDCVVTGEFHAPSQLAQPHNQNLELLRIGALYKLSAMIPRQLQVGGAVNTLPVPVTHCMSVAEGDLEQAVLGEIRAQPAPKPGPEKWHILPTVRFGNLVCAEVTMANYLAYFVPETADSPQNVNLVVGWTRVNPHPLYCGIGASIQAPVVNTGQDWFDTDDSHITIAVQDIHVASSFVTEERTFDIATSQLGPGARQSFELGPFVVDTYIDDLHRLQVTVDFDNEVDEINEVDNVWFTEYVLTLPPGYDKCEPPPLTGGWDNCTYQFDHRYEGSDLELKEAIENLEEAVFFPSRLYNSDDYKVESEVFAYLRNTVSNERWDLIESWFHTSRHNIMEAVWAAMIKSSERIHGARCEGDPNTPPS